ncbi:MAG TPA: hypothetical protein VEM96_19830 [Pyrinomonadaceae bacterium]|nr:hypothetical protein [Pyrinomonadaceae bacterium]
MWTQVTHGQIVDDIMADIGRELNVEFQQPSIAMFLHYRDGEWLYDEHGSRLDTKVSRWGTGAKRIVKGPTWDETENAYRERLNRELREAVNELMLAKAND